ncbi:MAG: aldose epimerase [Frankiales bacterium]|nr:aldose epimerase [Frankiales bacterium]
MPTLAPTGRQLALQVGPARAVVVELGGALRSLSVGGVDLVQGYAEHEPVTGGRGQHCAPWPNRVRDGAWRWRGQDLQLPIDETARGTALHGLVRWQPWEVLQHTAATAELRTLVLPQPGWPGALEHAVTWRLHPDGLRCELLVRNVGADDCPFGYAAHPYLVCPPAQVDELVLDLPARRQVLVDPVRLLPTGSARCEPGPRSLAGVQLDTCFGELGSDSATLLGPDGRGVELVADRAVFPWRQVYTGDDLPVVEQRRTAVALEPMTCPPDALRTGADLVVLSPGDAWEGQWELRAVR